MLSDLEIGRAIFLGAVFGEMGCENGLAAGYVDSKISSSVYYLIGWIGFSFIPGAGAAACARDAVQYFLEDKKLQAALSLVGVFPLLNAFKVEGAVTKFIAKNSGKEAEIAEVVVEDALKLAPNSVKIAVLDGLYSGAATSLKGKLGDEFFESYGDNVIEFLAHTAEDGVAFADIMDVDTLKKLFTISSPKLTTDLMSKLRVNLVKLNKDGVAADKIKSFIEHTDTLKNVEGFDDVVQRASTGNLGNFKGAAFEAEYAATTGNVDDIVEMAKRPNCVSQPGDLDLIRMGGGQKIGYEFIGHRLRKNRYQLH